jgi:imidazolonepropionase-like amidohydrolase
VEGGVSAVDAIASTTSIGADACGLSGRKGRIGPGFDADLLLVRGDPFADITAMREVEAVYLLGERVP